jgi:hypothetical protein
MASSEAGASLELATELADLFRTATRRLQRRTRDTLRPCGLSGSQARVVQLLADGPLGMSVIALRLTVMPRTATDVVDGCERAARVFGPLTERQRTELLTLLREIMEPEGDRR